MIARLQRLEAADPVLSRRDLWVPPSRATYLQRRADLTSSKCPGHRRGSSEGVRQMTVYVQPGQPGSVVSYESRYDNWIGGEWVAPVKGQYFENPSPVTGKTFCEVARGTAEDIELALDAAHAAAPAWGRTSVAERAEHPEQDRRPDRGRTSRCSPSPRPGTTASRSARRWPPTSRWPSTTSATSPARSAPRRARCPRSTTTPSPTTSTSRSASSARSSRGTSRS